jgi:hypothetical protein
MMMQTQIIIESWFATVQLTSDLMNKLGEEKMMKTVAPNRNRGIYLLGHLTAVHDAMLPLLGFREIMFPELKDIFLKNPDNLEVFPFTVTDLIQKWTAVNDELKKYFNHLTTEDWLQKHNAVSLVDFSKEPHRNKLNVVLSRTIHLSYHQGQLTLLK